MTVRVNMYTRFINNFRNNGITINKIIYDLTEKDRPVYQRVFQDGSVALQTSVIQNNFKSDTLVLIKSDGSVLQKITEIFKKDNGINKVKRWSSEKFSISKMGDILGEKKTEKFFLNGNLEEHAAKTIDSNGGVSNNVISYSMRKSSFPQTNIGMKLHPRNMVKYKEVDEGIRYIENYQHR